MLKTIFWAVFLFLASLLLVVNAVLSHSVPHSTFVIAQASIPNSPSEATPSSESATPQASESSPTRSTRTPRDSEAEAPAAENLRTLTPSEANNTQSESGGPYDMESIKAFNRALYGS